MMAQRAVGGAYLLAKLAAWRKDKLKLAY